ncbi:hypothetical protein [Sphingomonas crocodyli]|uniref:Uncharacterized protein n=1 Tax=Sphingomonas crocodyli TaxID=1979270 RepID=A0A437LYB3_9SPHN|nr:hypothetical protein [Sphingomonas crocodyli]RVT90411.1 hypothetical protein EOD43_19310 [Sphingomonas crocodyli]
MTDDPGHRQDQLLYHRLRGDRAAKDSQGGGERLVLGEEGSELHGVGAGAAQLLLDAGPETEAGTRGAEGRALLDPDLGGGEVAKAGSIIRVLSAVIPEMTDRVPHRRGPERDRARARGILDLLDRGLVPADKIEVLRALEGEFVAVPEIGPDEEAPQDLVDLAAQVILRPEQGGRPRR